MAKSRKTKAKHQDFQKVKLKVGKKLPKGLNETKTAFKSKSIQIKEQIKQDSKEATTKRKLTITELLSHCQHYNISARHDAVTGLRELILSRPDIIAGHLSNLIERVTPLCLDKDSVVRQATNRFFKILFENVPAGQVKPFFPVLSAHLRCAMTHIHDDVQLDSLQLMDLLLQNYPQLVTASNNKLLQCFIDQISKISQGAGAKSRRLIVNPGSKITGHKWRMKVLERLHNFMMAMAGRQHVEEKVKVPVMAWTSQNGCEHIPLLHCSSRWMCGTTNINRSHNEDSNGSYKEELHSRPFIEMLIPLLLQCWVEVGPAQQAANSAGNAMPADSLATLSTILSIILLIQQNLGGKASDNMEWMRSRFMKEFVQYFMAHFPYAAHEQVRHPKKKGKEKKDISQVSCLGINLCVCEVMSQFVKRNSGEDTRWCSQITHYLVQVTQRDNLSAAQLSSALNTVTTLLKLPLEQENEDEVIGAVFKLYMRKKNQGADKLALLDFFSNCIEEKMVNLGLTKIREWMRVLLQHLGEVNGQVSPVTLKLVEVTKMLACHDLPDFREAFQKYSMNIIGLISPGMEEVHKSTIELLTHLPEIEETHFVIIAKLCQDGILSPTNVKYLFQVIIYRAHMHDGRQVFTVRNFLSCLASCLIGYSSSDLMALQEISQQQSKIGRFMITSTNPEKMNRQLEVLKDLGEVLCEVPDESVVWDAVASALHSLVVKLKTLPEDLACSIFYTITKIMGLGFKPKGEILQTLVDLASSSLYYSYGAGCNVSLDPEKKTEPSLSLSAQCEAFLRSSWPSCETVFTRELQHILNAKQEQDVQVHITVLTKMLKDDAIRKNITLKKVEVEKLLLSAQEKHKNITSIAGWSDVKYAVSLLK